MTIKKTGQRRMLQQYGGFWIIGAYCFLYLLASYAAEHTGLIFSLCPLKNFTGLPCPFCGGTRAALALLQGELHTAWLLNPLATLLYFIAPILYFIHWQFMKNAIRTWRVPKLIWLGIITIVLINWIYLIHIGR